MKSLLFTVLLIVSFVVSFAAEKENKSDVKVEANQVVLTGSVVDQSTQEALVGVKVVLEGTDQVAYTDFDGNYSFKNLAPGKYNLSASYISYQKSSVENVKISLNSNQVDFSLKTTN